MKKEKLANIISIILGPQVWAPLIFLVGFSHSGINNYNSYLLLPSILVLQVFLPLAYLYLAPKVGLATSWDLPKREERYPFLGLVFITSLISLYLIHQFGDQFLFNLFLLFFILLSVVFVITLYWKISLHTYLNTFGVIFINYLFDWKLPFLFLTIPIVFWARLTLKKHTILQLLAGILISLGFMLLGFQFL